jgi:hypothetical protein
MVREPPTAFWLKVRTGSPPSPRAQDVQQREVVVGGGHRQPGRPGAEAAPVDQSSSRFRSTACRTAASNSRAHP